MNKKEPESFADTAGNSFVYQLSKATDHFGGRSDDPLEQVVAALKAAVWASRRIRLDAADLGERLKYLEFHIDTSSSLLKETLSNTELSKSIGKSAPISPSGLLTPAETATRLGISRASLTALTRDDRFPKPIYVSPKKTAFIVADIDRWVKGKAQ